MLFDVVGPVRPAGKKEVAFDRISEIFVNGTVLATTYRNCKAGNADENKSGHNFSSRPAKRK